MRRLNVSRIGVARIAMTAAAVIGIGTGYAASAGSAAGLSTASYVTAIPPMTVTGSTGVQHVSRTMARTVHEARAGRGYTVLSGDTLSAIASREYSRAYCWPGIYRSSRQVIGSNPNLIYPGQRLAVPGACDSAPVPVTASASDDAVQARSSGSGQGSRSGAPLGGGGSGTGRLLSGNLSFSGLEYLWMAAGGPSWARWDAATVAECESGGQQYAYNPSGASGYWQILGQVVFTGRSIFDPMTNALNAVHKFRASGDTFAQWVCQP